jgi:hypothetical protein
LRVSAISGLFSSPANIAPPQRLGLAPGSVEQHDAFDVGEDGALVRRGQDRQILRTASLAILGFTLSNCP